MLSEINPFVCFVSLRMRKMSSTSFLKTSQIHLIFENVELVSNGLNVDNTRRLSRPKLFAYDTADAISRKIVKREIWSRVIPRRPNDVVSNKKMSWTL